MRLGPGEGFGDAVDEFDVTGGIKRLVNWFM